MRLKDFSSAILGTSIAFEKTQIVAGARDGEFRAWEPRMFQVNSLINSFSTKACFLGSAS